MLTAQVVGIGLPPNERFQSAGVHCCGRGDDFDTHRPRGNNRSSLAKASRCLDPGGGGQPGGIAEAGRVRNVAGPEGPRNQPRPIRAEKRREYDSGHAEVRVIVQGPECNQPIPKAEPAVEIRRRNPTRCRSSSRDDRPHQSEFVARVLRGLDYPVWRQGPAAQPRGLTPLRDSLHDDL